MTLAFQPRPEPRPALPLDRLPAQNLEAEQSVLGGILFDNAVLHQIATFLRVEDFYRDTHQTIYRAILGLYDHGKAVDGVTLADELTRRGEFSAIGGDDMLEKLIDAVPHAANVVYHAQIVQEKAIARELEAGLAESLRDCRRNTFTATELVESAEHRIFAVRACREQHRAKTGGEAARMALDEIYRRMQGEVTGVPTGYMKLDEMIDGMRPGNMIVLAARPSQGKSALALNIAEYAALKLGVFTGFVSLEMSAEELGKRLLSSQSRIDAERFKQPGRFLKDRDLALLTRKVQEITEGRLHIDETPGLTVSQIGALARQWVASKQMGLLVVDYLGKINGQPQRGESRQVEVSRISSGLKNIARECKIPLLVLHQLNRQSELREDRRPRLADLRDSGQIEADADVVILLHRPEFYNAADRPGEADLFIAKNRMGSTGPLKLTFLKEISRFENLAQANAPGREIDWTMED